MSFNVLSQVFLADQKNINAVNKQADEFVNQHKSSRFGDNYKKCIEVVPCFAEQQTQNIRFVIYVEVKVEKHSHVDT